MGARATIWLVGMMGAGKSATGAALARRLGVPFADTDERVVRSASRAIPRIFADEGETGFRAREADAIAELAGEPCVVALGGGAIAQPGVAERLAASGTIVYLRARPETLLARLGDGRDRPLVAGLGREARLDKLRELLAARERAYGRATLVVDTDDLDPEAVAERVAKALSSRETG